MKRKLLFFFTIFYCVASYAQTQNTGSTSPPGRAPAGTALSHAKTGNGTGSLGQTYEKDNVCGLNYVSASVLTETRSISAGFNTTGTGFPAVLPIAGLPCGGPIVKAYAYWSADYEEATAPNTSIVITNPSGTISTTAATQIGTGADLFWSPPGKGTACYRADITGSVNMAGNGNYKVNLTGFTDAGWEVDGVAIIIVYQDLKATYSGGIALWDGCYVETVGGGLGPVSYSITQPICAAATTNSAFVLMGDAQTGINTPAVVTDNLNGSAASFPAAFWQLNTINNTTVTNGQASISDAVYTNNSLLGDAYVWELAGLYWQNTTCVVCTPVTLTATVTSTGATCGSNNGTATVTASGGITAYTYSWAPGGQTTSSITGLGVGNYTVTVTDACGDVSTATTTITQPNLVTVAVAIASEVSCNGGNNGSGTVSGGGGNAPYTYSWNPSGQTTSTGTGLSAGIYTVTVTNNAGCSTTTTITITQPSPITTTTSSTAASCNLSNGSATVNPSGGTMPYTYLWNPSGQTTPTATGIPVGTYTVTITTNTGCTTTTTVTVTQPSAVTATISATTGVSCNGGNNGTATATATGGTAPYTYTWTPIGGNNAIANGLSAGTYTVNVIDKNGCISTATTTITQPNLLTVTTTMTQATCGTSNGSATATVTGGTVPYNYAWAPGGGNTATINGISAGTYTCTVTDKNNCIATSIIVVTNIGGPTVTINPFTNVLCNGGNNGSATATVTGGSLPYTYTWTPAGGNNATANGLTAGTYTVTVKDANGCTSVGIVTITQPIAITSTTSFTPASCNLSNGSATVVAANGTSPYTYLWNPSGETAATATGIPIGTYTVTITDNNGCSETNSVTVTQPSAVTAIISGTTPTSCNGGNNGSATATATGGTAPYTYAWTPIGGNNAIANGLSAGTYTVTVTDNTGCVSTATAVVAQPTLLTATIGLPTEVLCNGGNNGSATATATGGTPPYTYAWAPSGGNSATGTGFSAGTYTINVTDKNGCTASATILITQPTPLGTTTSFIAAYCNLPNGSATVSITGGTGPYTYLWNPSSETTATATGLAVGTYTVGVIDNNGCTASNTVTVTEPSAVVAGISGTTGTSCNGGNDGSASATANGGTAPYTFLWEPGGNTNQVATGLDATTYTVIVTDASGCTSSAVAIVTQPPLLTVSISGPLTLCVGAPGTLTATATGGTAPYTYAWSPGIASTTSTASIAPTVATTYTVIVTDANGCKATNVFTVNLGSLVYVSISGAASVCQNSPVTLCANATGGTGGNVFTWQPGNYSTPCITVSPSATTTYSVTVMDNCGSTDTASAVIQVNPRPNVQFSSNLNKGCMPLCIQFYNTTTMPDGSIPTAYDWQFGDGNSFSSQSAFHCYPDSGEYTVTLTVISDSGCSATLRQPNMIHAFGLPKAAFTFSPQPAYISSPTIQFTDQTTDPADNQGIAYWTWTFGDKLDSVGTAQNPTHTYQDTGTYCTTLAVMDYKGCTDTVTNCLVIDPIFTLYIPNAFTPNGDGMDDIFAAKGTYVKDFEMYIFDRWGEQLFHSTDINKGWNGTVKGGTTISQEDVYVYKILATDWQNHQHSYIGSVSLIK